MDAGSWVGRRSVDRMTLSKLHSKTGTVGGRTHVPTGAPQQPRRQRVEAEAGRIALAKEAGWGQREEEVGFRDLFARAQTLSLSAQLTLPEAHSECAGKVTPHAS